MTAGSWIRCDGCGRMMNAAVLSPQELRDSVADEYGWVTTAHANGYWVDACSTEECRDSVAALAGIR